MRNAYFFTAARPLHAALAAPELAPLDLREIELSTLLPPEKALERWIRLSSKAWAGYVGSELLALFGVIPLSVGLGIGSPWFVTTRAVSRHRRTFLRAAREGIARLRTEFSALRSLAPVENPMAVRWLEWLGFTVEPEPIAFGPYGAPFFVFSKGWDSNE